MKKNKQRFNESLNANDILRKRKQKIAIISIASLIGILVIVFVSIMIMKNSGEETDDDRSVIDILLNRNAEEDVEDDYNKIKPVLDKDGNVVKTEAEVAYDNNKIVKNQFEQFANEPGEDEDSKEDATVTDVRMKIKEVEKLMNQYKFISAETLIREYFKEHKRTSEDEELEKELTKLSNYQLDVNMLSNIGLAFEEKDYIAHTSKLYADEDQYKLNLQTLENPLSFLYAHIELPVDYQQSYTLDTKYGLYLYAHIYIKDLIKIKEVKQLTDEELGRDAGYFESYKEAYAIDFVYDRTNVVATIVKNGDGYFQMVGIRLKEYGANNQFYTLAEWKLMDENLAKGKSMFDGVDTTRVNDYITGNETKDEYSNESYDISAMGGGI